MNDSPLLDGACHCGALRLRLPALLELVCIRRFDGADTWAFPD